MPETLDIAQHVKPFVYETLFSKALHFSICEIQSRMDLRDPYALDLEYTRTMMAFLLFVPEPKRIAMIGLGGGSLAKFCHHNLLGTSIDVVEINPHVIALRDEFHVPADGERFRVICGDGAQYVRRADTPCDVLMVDGFNSDGLPSGLCSQRFYDDAYRMLQPDGMMIVNLHYGHQDYARYVERIRRSFSGAILVVEEGECGNSIVFACKGSALQNFRTGVIRPPRALNKSAATQLLASFALVNSAWLGQFG